MKGCIAIVLAVLITFSTSAIAEYYVVNGSPYPVVIHLYGYDRHPIKKAKPPIVKTTVLVKTPVLVNTSCKPVKQHIVRKHHWKPRKSCYDLDLATGDDDPCVDPNMDIDK